MAVIKSSGSTGDISDGVSRGVGGYEAMVDEVGVGREEGALGRAIGIGIVNERRFELRDVTDPERMERVSMALPSSVIDQGVGGTGSDICGWLVTWCLCVPPPC